MDIRRLIDRIADVLGADATPSRVEAVAAAVLDVTGVAESSSVLPTTRNSVIITAFGLDRPGILAAVTNVVSGAGCNITDVSQKILQEYFTLIMLADISAMHLSLEDLQRQLAEAGTPLGVRVTAQHEDLFASMHRP